MSLAPGTRLGPYEVVALIGAGGMGEVYRARDARLDRDVALKVLPQAVARDADRLARFQREARVLARLNHPNIAQVFGLEESNGVTAIAMELVDGSTLDFMLARGPLPIDDAIRLALQICEALEAAHAQDIVHRDLKPANIKVRPDGTLKVLDFGLAKPGGASTTAETVSIDGTEPGTVLGTVAYMSPEQAKGQDVGPQADVWAFGCVLFEMLTARRAFGRDSAAETIAAVITELPDLDRLPATTPAMVRRVIKRCLEKDTRERMHHIGDVRADLRDARSGPGAVVNPPPRLSSHRAAAVAGAAAAIVALGSGWWIGRTSSQVASAPIRLAMPFVERPRDMPFGISRIAISPDGDRIAYAGSGQLWMRRLRDKDPQGLGVGGFDPFFSPDGQWVAAFTGEHLVKIPADGGPPTPLALTTERFGGGVWLENGTIIFATNAGLYRIADTGGTAELVVAPDRAKGQRLFSSPAALPGSGRVMITIASGTTPPEFTTAAIDLETRTITRVLEHASAARYVNTGHLLYASRGGLKAIGFNSRTLEVSSPAVDLADLNVGVPVDNGIGDYAVAGSGTVAFLPPQPRQRPSTLVWVDRDGTEEPLAVEAGPFMYARVSPNGRQIALDVIGATNRDIWILDVARLTQARLTDGPTEDVLPMWSPDGRRVFFGSDRQGNFDVYSQAADGASQATLEFGGPGFQAPESLTPDAGTLVLLEDYTAMRLVDLSGTRTLTPLLGGNFEARLGQVSPNGRWIAYESNESGGGFEIYLRPFPNVNDGREKVSIAGGRYPVWSAKGDELFYQQTDGHMMVAPVVTSGASSVGTVQRLFRWEPPVTRVSGRSYDVSPIDGRFLLLKSQPGADPGPTHVSVILNWFEDLRTRARAQKPG
jgi:dipeptidyl aminopeptidase/acylaminoacyl peptidase